MTQRQRKQNFIDGNVQGSLLRRIFIHWLSFFTVCTLAIVLLQTVAGDPNVALSERLMAQFGDFTFFAVVMAALLPAFMLDTIRFSNRFVGPITRLRRHVRELGEGNTTHFEFRGSDFWQDMATEFNVVTDLVRTQQDRIRELEIQLGHRSEASSDTEQTADQ